MERPLLWLLFSFAAVALACARGAPDRAPDAVSDLSGRWRLVELGGAAPTGDPPWLELGEDGAVAGHAGVNRFSGRADAAALRSGTFSTGPMAVTRMAGPPERMELEQRFLAALGEANRVRVRAGRLELARDERVLARFERAG